MTTNGPLPDGISYLNTGANLQWSASLPTNDANTNPIVTLNIRVSGFAPGDMSKPGESADRPAARGVTLENAAPLEFGHALTVTALSSQDARGKNVAPTLYVARYTFDKPSSNSPTEASATNEVADGVLTTNATARFQATVYELDAIPFRVNTLNATALATHAATEDDLLHSLNENGKARVVQHVDKNVNLRTDRLQLGGNEMIPTRAITTGDGQIHFSKQAMRTGVMFDFSSLTIPAGKPGEGSVETTAVNFSCLVPRRTRPRARRPGQLPAQLCLGKHRTAPLEPTPRLHRRPFHLRPGAGHPRCLCRPVSVQPACSQVKPAQDPWHA